MRVILAQPRGFCAGVERAIEIVERAIRLYGPPVYVRHEIVHNKRVVEDLKAKGAVFVEELDEVPKGAITVFSAHGVSQKVEDTAKERSLPVIDATCPLVAKVHKEGQRYAEKDYEVVLIGHEGHPEVEGTMGPDPRQGASRIDAPRRGDRGGLRSEQALLCDSNHIKCGRYARSYRSAESPLSDDRRSGRQGHLLRDAEPTSGGEGVGAGSRRHSSRRCPEQLELEPAAGDRYGKWACRAI